MAGASRQLPVPYLTQPDATTCQSTVLKMMAAYLEREVVGQSTGATAKAIREIKQEINGDPGRPDKKLVNSHANFKWWLQRHFPSLTFNYVVTKDEIGATETIVKTVDLGFPVLVSVSHARVAGHIVLVVGYSHYRANQSSPDFRWIVHDPYGQFDPSLLSSVYGRRRFTGGMSLVSGDEVGPGRNLSLEPPAISRRRRGDGAVGTYYLLYPSR